MAKSSKSQDRRAVVEQMRREQKRAESRRTYAIVAACAVVALVILGLGAYPLLSQQRAASGALGSLGVPADAANCDEEITASAAGSNDHRPDGEDIAYQDGPPAFGPHYATTAPFERKFYSAADRPPVENLVHNLEHGYNVLWYDQTVIDDNEALGAVRGIAESFSGEQQTDKFIAAPWTEEDGKPFPPGKHVALTHWTGGSPTGGEDPQQGIWRYCGQPSGEVVSQFHEDHPYSDSPEPDAM